LEQPDIEKNQLDPALNFEDLVKLANSDPAGAEKENSLPEEIIGCLLWLLSSNEADSLEKRRGLMNKAIQNKRRLVFIKNKSKKLQRKMRNTLSQIASHSGCIQSTIICYYPPMTGESLRIY